MSSDARFTYSGNISWWAYDGFQSPKDAINAFLPDIEIYDIEWAPGTIIIVESVAVGRYDSGDVKTELVRHWVGRGDSLIENPNSTGPLNRYAVVYAE